MSKKTPLYDCHVKLSAKLCEFAGYDMPIQYPEGVVKEHEWVRSKAGIFDVSHMGQVFVRGQGLAELFSKITPSPFLKTPEGKAKYTVLTNEQGGIIDDLIITKVKEDEFFAVLNAACKEKDMSWIEQHLSPDQEMEYLEGRGLIALQGKSAEKVLQDVLGVDASGLSYMSFMRANIFGGEEIFVSRLGYTGEDGFEISVAGDVAPKVWESLLENDEVRAIGLAARDSLRLEMGYPLYGHDIDGETSPIEADLAWVVGKTNEGFNGSERILKEREEGVGRKRVGIKLVDKGIAREGADIESVDGKVIGKLTSGGFSPSLKQAIGQGYVDINYANADEKVNIVVRGRKILAVVDKLPFIQPGTK